MSLLVFPSGLYLEEKASTFDIVKKSGITSHNMALGLKRVTQDNEFLKKAECMDRCNSDRYNKISRGKHRGCG